METITKAQFIAELEADNILPETIVVVGDIVLARLNREEKWIYVVVS